MSRQLADFSLGLRRQDIPTAVRDKARAHLMDVLGVALASSTFDFGAAALTAARELGSGSEAHALGSGVSLPAASAALVNGTLAHGLDFDDTHIAAIYHASAPAMAAALAAGEAANASGADPTSSTTPRWWTAAAWPVRHRANFMRAACIPRPCAACSPLRPPQRAFAGLTLRR